MAAMYIILVLIFGRIIFGHHYHLICHLLQDWVGHQFFLLIFVTWVLFSDVVVVLLSSSELSSSMLIPRLSLLGSFSFQRFAITESFRSPSNADHQDD